MKYESCYVLFCESSTDDEAVQNAKNYCRDNNLSFDDVKIVRNGTKDTTSVIVR